MLIFIREPSVISRYSITPIKEEDETLASPASGINEEGESIQLYSLEGAVPVELEWPRDECSKSVMK